MSVKRFVAATSREALARVRRELGPDAVILANRRTPMGIEVTAVADGELDKMVAGPVAVKAAEKPAAAPETAKSFKEFVAQAYASETPTAAKPVVAKTKPPVAKKPVIAEPIAPVTPPPAVTVAAAPVAHEQHLRNEIAALKQSLERRLADIAWNGVAAQDPARAQLANELADCGFSKELIHLATAKAGTAADINGARQTIESLLTANLACAGEHDLLETGGVFAFVGPTGVGKTTTVAKVAARAVVRHGAAKVALVAADGFRIGAQDQLRTYARILGVPLMVAQDREQLAQVLESLKDRHLVLVDTAGLGPRDPRLADLATLLDQPRVRKVLLLSATAQSESLEHSVRAYAKGATGAILTKLDEAVKLAGAVEVLLRHRLTLHFVTNGQRVPEDLHSAHARLLVHRAMRLDGDLPPLGETDFLPWKRAA